MNNNIMNYLEKHNEVDARKLQKSIMTTNTILKELLNDLNKKTIEFQKEKKYDEVLEVVKVQKEVATIQEHLQVVKILNDAEDNEIQSTVKAKVKSKSKRTKRKPEYIDYKEYLVDTTVPYPISEDFRHTRPHAFSVGEELVLVSTWRELLIKTSEVLNKINPEIFKTFLTDKTMFWGEKANFVTNKKDVRNGVLIEGSDIYIETSKNSMASIQLIKKMLDKYGISQEDYKVYLRANYAPRHENKESFQNVATTKDKSK